MKKIALLTLLCSGVTACTHDQAGKGAPGDIGSTITTLGYQTVLLPSTAYGPGALVTTVKGSGFSSPLNLTYLCRPDFAHAPAPILDVAQTRIASQSLDSSFKLDPASLTRIGLGANLSHIQSVSLKLTNVSVEQLGFDDLEQVRSSLGPVCKRIIDTFSKDALAYQTKQAIRADVEYSFELKQGASADVKGAVIKALVAAFGGSVKTDNGLTASGKGLYYGLILTKV
ncbi:hypothetical protein N2601_08805 [Rhizobium sp. CB3060]|uniref:hypothetical protein n=1 Tax=Rhizobium sp. CB3060 TaxID=3138255 RepID=UPI0021A611F0|nr:hypothetical protein [Rhizobium tropici]UWU23027.1 hypothetical protein N2601_08805 [Rhizobium tropici]